MTSTTSQDLSLLSWNILAPCWIYKEWYPTPALYDLAADEQARLKLIIDHISSLRHDIVMLQEAQEDRLFLFKEKLGDDYFFEFAPNNPTPSPKANGLLTLVRKDYAYASEIKIINGILDLERGDAIQIIEIPSKSLHLLNLHIDFFHRVVQAKMIYDRCNTLLGTTHSIALMAGDLNAEVKDHYEFEWVGFENVFSESSKYAHIPTYYGDPGYWENMMLDHILYDPHRLEPLTHGKAYATADHTLEDAFKQFGSDHIYVWATFRFRPNTIS